MPVIYIIAGCNGAGKTTASHTVLPEMLNCTEFVNADSIAAGISPFNPESVSFEAGRIMLERINKLILERQDFAFETTLSTRSYASLIKHAQQSGYVITLVFFWLSSPELAIQRVAERVQHGGHNIPKSTIIRRYYRGLTNLFQLFIPICNLWIMVDNSDKQMSYIAKGQQNLVSNVLNTEIWDIISSKYATK